MPDRKNHSTIKLVVIIIAIAYSLKLIGLIRITDTFFFSYALPVYGIVAVYFSFNTDRKSFLFFSTAVFMTGVMFYVIDNFYFLSTASMILPSVLFILGSCFIILYLEDFLNKIFLFSAIILVLFSTVLVLMSSLFFVKRGLTILGNIFIDYYPLLIIVIGIMIFTQKKKLKILS